MSGRTLTLVTPDKPIPVMWVRAHADPSATPVLINVQDFDRAAYTALDADGNDIADSLDSPLVAADATGEAAPPAAPKTPKKKKATR